jgi:hypothetical protein
MDVTISDLQRRCLETARANQLAEGLPPLKFVVHFDDERRRLRWEPGSPKWREWARQVEALGCTDDRHIWKVDDESSFDRWRAYVLDEAMFSGADLASLKAMGVEELALAVAARSPILGCEPRRRGTLRPMSPLFATRAAAKRAEAGLKKMGVSARFESWTDTSRPAPNGGSWPDHLYAWEILASEFGYGDRVRTSPEDEGRIRYRVAKVFDLGAIDKEEFDAAAKAVVEAFKGLAKLGLAEWYTLVEMPTLRLSDSGLAEAETPGAGLAMENPPRVRQPASKTPKPAPKSKPKPQKAEPPIPRPESDPDRLAVLAYAMGIVYKLKGKVAPLTEFPCNLISRWAVVDEAGGIGRLAAPSDPPNPDEVELSRRLADEAADIMEGVEVGMGSASSDDYFWPFFIAARVGQAPPSRIDADLIRDRFGRTILPLAVVLVEPVAEEGSWWGEATYDGDIDEPERLAPWQAMVRWFRDQPAFVDTAFVSIGDASLANLAADELPVETQIVGCVWPRLVLGLTAGGSLAGIYGVTVRA